MAENGYRKRYANGVLGNDEYQEEHLNGEKYDGDTEKGPTITLGYEGKDEPFGDETNNEVKYRTMAWW